MPSESFAANTKPGKPQSFHGPKDAGMSVEYQTCLLYTSFLTLDELTAMTEIKLEDPNMAFARDLFIFGSWTGIAFIDIKSGIASLSDEGVAEFTSLDDPGGI